MKWIVLTFIVAALGLFGFLGYVWFIDDGKVETPPRASYAQTVERENDPSPEGLGIVGGFGLFLLFVLLLGLGVMWLLFPVLCYFLLKKIWIENQRTNEILDRIGQRRPPTPTPTPVA